MLEADKVIKEERVKIPKRNMIKERN